MPATDHASRTVPSVPCSILTVSDTRTEETDRSGHLIRELLERDGHRVVRYSIVADEPAELAARVRQWADAGDVSAILINGGTGLAPRDTTYEAVADLLDKRLDGFGELFRALSYDQIGSGAMLSRAVAGLHNGCAIFSMPGSTGAVRLAMEKLILPELGHIIYLLDEPGKKPERRSPS